MTNEQKAKTLVDGLGIIYTDCNRVTIKKLLMKMAQWKDEQLIEQLTAFAQHLNKRGAFCEDLCMDFEHEAQSFIEMQNKES